MANKASVVSDQSWLRQTSPPISGSCKRIVRTVDLFAGCGGLSLGVREACRRLGFHHQIEFASEWDPNVLSIFKKNMRPSTWSSDDITHHLDIMEKGSEMSEKEKHFADQNPNLHEVDILTGGPPCQGHSDLNNHTRRGDDRNNLYFAMLRFATIFKPKSILIENVRSVVHSKERVSQRTIEELTKLGYICKDVVLKAVHFGVPQTRERHFLLASFTEFSILGLLEKSNQPSIDVRNLRWAIEDLEQTYDPTNVFDSSSKPSPRNQERMNYLIENEIHDLPDHERPPCHQNGHNYPAVYGRLHWDRPAPTITAGYPYNGQGRFQHPSANPGRTLTPHEAARIQTFPDWYDFSGCRRSVLKKAIGNAVPPLLGMAASIPLLESFEVV